MAKNTFQVLFAKVGREVTLPEGDTKVFLILELIFLTLSRTSYVQSGSP